MRFADARELEDVLGSFFEQVAQTENAYLIHQVGGVVEFLYHRPEAVLRWVPQPGGQPPFRVERGPGRDAALLVFEQDGDTAHRFWLGRLNLQDALARQLVRARGPLARAMKLVPKLDDIYPLYRRYLEDSGRKAWVEEP